MSECKYPTCRNPVGQQDRDDYKTHSFCSIQCETKYNHIKADARDAKREPEEPAPGREP